MAKSCSIEAERPKQVLELIIVEIVFEARHELGGAIPIIDVQLHKDARRLPFQSPFLLKC